MKKLIALIAAMVFVAGTAYAAEWNFYGSSRIATYVTDLDVANTDNYAQALQGNSRIGAKVKVSDELTGGFEYGTGVNVRLLYGEWNFGAGSLLVGQHYSPLNMFYSNSVEFNGGDRGLLDLGGVYSGREAMLRLTFGDFQIAAVPANTSIDGTATVSETNIPAIEASYALNMGPAALKLAGGYQSFETTAGDIDSYVFALGGKVNFGMAYVAGNAWMGENAGNLIGVNIDNPTGFGGDGLANATGTTVLDSDDMGFILVIGAKLNDMFSVEAGYGYVEEEMDASTTDDELKTYYVQATVTLAPGVFIVPEFGVIDAEEQGQEEVTYYGVKWQINF